MLISYDKLDKYAPSWNGTIHGGAHALEEYEYYESRATGPVFWFEADPATALRYEDKVRETDWLICYALWDSVGEMTFHRANNDQSSSVLELGTHKEAHPEVHYVDNFTVATITLDHMNTILMASNVEGLNQAEFLALDIQGAELHALRGATHLLSNSLKYLYLEVNKEPLYAGCALLPEIDKFVAGFGFKRVITEMTHFGWGDAFWVKG